MLSNPLSTVPLLHLRRNANVTIDVNLFHCGKLKLALDFTELLAQRSASNIDFVGSGKGQKCKRIPHCIFQLIKSIFGAQITSKQSLCLD